jgi:hypothetical protein
MDWILMIIFFEKERRMGRMQAAVVAAMCLAVGGAQVLGQTGGRAGATAGATAGAKLNYQQVNLLKDAKYYLDGGERGITDLTAAVDKMKVGDASVPLRQVQAGIGTVAAIRKQMGYATDRLKQLPAEHADVKVQADRVKPMEESLAALEAKLKEVEGGLKGVVATGEGEGYQTDMKRLREITVTYGDPRRVLETRAKLAVELIGQLPAVKEERKKLGEKYAGLVAQKGKPGQDISGVMAYADEQVGAFEKAEAAFAAAAPGRIDGALSELQKLAKEGVDNKKPLYFGEKGGIVQRFDQVDNELMVWKAIAGEAAVKGAADKVAAARADVKRMGETMLADIVATNGPPVDSYCGADREQLLGMLKAKATEGFGGKAEVLKVGLNSTQWDRDTRWKWQDAQSSFYKIDVSRMQGWVLVKASADMAAVYHVNFSKDHMKGDAIDAYFFDDPKGEVGVRQKVLMKNVK